MEYLIGLLLALAVAALPAATGLGKGRDFYPIVLIVVASYYVLFAATRASAAIVLLECAVAAVFVTSAVLGFRHSLAWVAAALVGHGLLDSVHHLLIANPGVPETWPGFCMAFDVVAGLVLALRLALPRMHPVSGS